MAYEQIPPQAIRILLAVEDAGFFRHPGVSTRGILRALWQNASAGEVISGGSTLTQQLVRLGLRPEHRGYAYKAKEALLALKLESRRSKKEILEAYLNRVYFGQQAYGLQAASQAYFAKNAAELSLAEASFLIGLIQSPESYNPFRHLALAKKRHQTVQGILARSGAFSAEELAEIKNEPLSLASGKTRILAPHFVMWLLENRKEEVGQRSQEGQLRTSLDLDLQRQAETLIQRHLEGLKDKNVTSGAAVVLEVRTGEILAMVGSADYFDAEHDGAVNVAVAQRQPGSTLKPFVYALALKSGDTAASTVADVETRFFTQEGNPYVPRNYDYGYHGLVRYREALANSYNIAAVKVLEKVGVRTLMDFLDAAGIRTFTRSPQHYGLALALGSGEVKLLELVQAYAMLARQGRALSAIPFPAQEDASGERILDEKIAWLVSDILDDDAARLPEFGEGGPLEFPFPVAAKTGTTRDSRDNWTVGYTPDVAVGVWVGNADNQPMIGTSGITGAGPIFHDLMLAAASRFPSRAFARPDELRSLEICKLSGLRMSELCPHALSEWFIEGSEPKQEDDIFRRIRIDKRNGLLAFPSCPPEETQEEVFAFFPPELQTWAAENGWPAPPRQPSPLCPPDRDPSFQPGEGELPLAQESQEGSWMLIESPAVGESYQLDPLVPDASEQIVFRATASADIRSIQWSVNGQTVCQSIAPPRFPCVWAPQKGRFRVTAAGGGLDKEVEIEIR